MNTEELIKDLDRDLRFARIAYTQGDSTMSHRDFELLTRDRVLLVRDPQDKIWKTVHHFVAAGADVLFLAEIFDVDGETNVDEPDHTRTRMIWVHEHGFNRSEMHTPNVEVPRKIFRDDFGTYQELSWVFMYQAGIDEGLFM